MRQASVLLHFIAAVFGWWLVHDGASAEQSYAKEGLVAVSECVRILDQPRHLDSVAGSMYARPLFGGDARFRNRSPFERNIWRDRVSSDGYFTGSVAHNKGAVLDLEEGFGANFMSGGLTIIAELPIPRNLRPDQLRLFKASGEPYVGPAILNELVSGKFESLLRVIGLPHSLSGLVLRFDRLLLSLDNGGARSFVSPIGDYARRYGGNQSGDSYRNAGPQCPNLMPPIIAFVGLIIGIAGVPMLIAGHSPFTVIPSVLGIIFGCAAFSVWLIFWVFPPEHYYAHTTESNYKIIDVAFSDHVSAALWIDASATCYGRAEDVDVLPVIVPELEFGDIQGHIFPADLVERADDAALEDRPEALNRVRMNRADDVFAIGMLDDFVLVRKFVFQIPVAGPLVGDQQADFVRDGFADKFGQDVRAHDARDDAALALDYADHRHLARTNAAATLRPIVLVPLVLVVCLAADERFVDLDNASKPLRVAFGKSGADAVAHVERGFIRAEAHDALDL
jgi:hypothetical protein